jgi:hypothetical protein
VITKEEITASGNMLAEHIPGWHWKVDPDQLNMSNCSWCVLGQLSDGARATGPGDISAPTPYSTMAEKLISGGIPLPGWAVEAWAVRWSFSLPQLLSSSCYWAKLNQQWRAEIQRRRDADILQESSHVPAPALA